LFGLLHKLVEGPLGNELFGGETGERGVGGRLDVRVEGVGVVRKRTQIGLGGCDILLVLEELGESTLVPECLGY